MVKVLIIMADYGHDPTGQQHPCQCSSPSPPHPARVHHCTHTHTHTRIHLHSLLRPKTASLPHLTTTKPLHCRICVTNRKANLCHAPTEVAVPYQAFKDAAFDVNFATETGKTPRCDSRMLEGLSQKLLVRTPISSFRFTTRASSLVPDHTVTKHKQLH